MQTDQEPRAYPMIWAVRAVPVLLIFCTLDLLQRDPPIVFLVLTLARLGLGVGVLLAIRTRRRDWLALSFVVFVFLSSLANPVRGEQVLLLSAIGLVVIGVDQVRQRRKPVEPVIEPEHDPAINAAINPEIDQAEGSSGVRHSSRETT